MNSVAKELLSIIERNGFEAYLVGGYPRDFLLNIETDDFDICTNAKKEELEKIFNIPLKDNFGSFVLKYKDITFEITTYRKEVSYSGVREPNITYTSKLEEDIIRRDFTINAICMNSKEEIIDLIDGVKDLNNGVIKSVGDPDIKLTEDPLRILRAIRLASVLNFEIDDELSLAIKNNNYRVKELSYFRKKQELDKIFNSSNVNKGLKLLKFYNLHEYLEIDFENVIKTSNIGMWAQIKHSSHYSFSKRELETISKIRELITKREISNYDLYIYGIDIALIAGEIIDVNLDDIRDRYLGLSIKNRIEIDINYDDIIKYTNIRVSDVYTVLEKEILSNSLKNKREYIINYLKNLVTNDIDK